jgi:hypothetical protein
VAGTGLAQEGMSANRPVPCCCCLLLLPLGCYLAVCSVLRPKKSMPMQNAASKYPGGACTARLLPAMLPTAVPAARPAAMRQSTFPSLRAGSGRAGAAGTHANQTNR